MRNKSLGLVKPITIQNLNWQTASSYQTGNQNFIRKLPSPYKQIAI